MTTSTTTRPALPTDQPTPRTQRWRWVWLAVGASLLPFTMFQTIVPVAAWLSHLFLLRFTRTTRARVGLPIVAVVGYLATLVALRGVWDETYLWALPGLGLVIGYGADKLLVGKLPVALGTLVLPAVDTAVAYLASLDRSAFGTWGAVGYSQVPNLVLTQGASIVGVWGIGFVVMWTASVVNAWWETGFRLHEVRRPVGIWLTVMVVLIGFGSFRLAMPSASSGVQVAAITLDPGLNEALVSGPVGPGPRSEAEREALSEKYMEPILDDLFARTRQAAAAGAKIVAWSEASAFVFAEDEAELVQRARRVAMDEEIYLEMGVISLLAHQGHPTNENMSLLFGPDGTLLWKYHKSSVVGGDGNEPGPGELPVVDTPYGRLSVAICFDGDFPSLIRQASRQGADILLLPSSDWEAIARSHADMAVLRAVESGMSVVRPTRQGFSSMLDPYGRTLAFGADFFSGEVPILMGTVPTERVATVYTGIGDIVGYGSILASLGLAGAVTALRWRGRRHMGRSAPSDGLGGVAW